MPSLRVCVTKRAFTLIELLVVVAIIAVLISILLPSLGAARKQAKALLCSTNLKNQGNAAQLYASNFNDWMIRAIATDAYTDKHGDAGFKGTEYSVYSMALLPGLSYTGKVLGLWRVYNQVELIEILRTIPAFQCPTHPDPKQPLDYVGSAFPIPYTRLNRQTDENGPPGNSWRGEQPGDYFGHFRYGMINRFGPARLILATEVNAEMPTNEIRFHHVFYSNQLPFGAYPRIANDLRHPGGLNALFFDGHVERMALSKMDLGWPRKPIDRLRWFTAPYDD